MNRLANILFARSLGAAGLGLLMATANSAWAQDAVEITSQSDGAAASPSYAICSKAFHKDLTRINFTLAEPLREAVVAGRTRDKARARELTLPVPRMARSRDLQQAIYFAARSARGQGSDSWLRSEGGRWLTDSISTGLVRYTGQPESPFLCTGMDAYLGYLQPHQKKLTRINTTRTDHFIAAMAAVDPAFEAAWLAMRPVPLPKFRPTPAVQQIPSSRVSPVQNDALRSTSAVDGKIQDLDETTTGSTPNTVDDPDLPPLTEPEGQFELEALSDVPSALQVLHARLLETGNLAADTPSPLADTGFDPAAIIANARAWVRGNAPAIANSLVRRQVLVALSAYEVAAVIDTNSYPLRVVEERMGGTFEAIRASHAEHCGCQ